MTIHPEIVQPGQPIVLFDGGCGICSYWVDFVTRRDHAGIYRFTPLESDEGRTLLQKAGFPRDYSDSIVLLDHQGTWTHSTAVLRILGRLGGALRVASLLIWLPRPLRDFGYRLVARSRHGWSGGGQSCRLPSRKEANRPRDPARH